MRVCVCVSVCVCVWEGLLAFPSVSPSLPPSLDLSLSRPLSTSLSLSTLQPLFPSPTALTYIHTHRVKPEVDLQPGSVYHGYCPNCHEKIVFKPETPVTSTLIFTLNGKKQTVESPDPTMSLNEYIRTVAGLKVLSLPPPPARWLLVCLPCLVVSLVPACVCVCVLVIALTFCFLCPPPTFLFCFFLWLRIAL